jgi:hypothetical protein
VRRPSRSRDRVGPDHPFRALRRRPDVRRAADFGRMSGSGKTDAGGSSRVMRMRCRGQRRPADQKIRSRTPKTTSRPMMKMIPTIQRMIFIAFSTDGAARSRQASLAARRDGHPRKFDARAVGVETTRTFAGRQPGFGGRLYERISCELWHERLAPTRPSRASRRRDRNAAAHRRAWLDRDSPHTPARSDPVPRLTGAW